MSDLENRKIKEQYLQRAGKMLRQETNKKQQPADQKSGLKISKKILTSKKNTHHCWGRSRDSGHCIAAGIFCFPGWQQRYSDYYEYWTTLGKILMETTMKSREDGSYTLTENIFAQLSDDYDFIGRTMDDKYIVYRKEERRRTILYYHR